MSQKHALADKKSYGILDYIRQSITSRSREVIPSALGEATFGMLGLVLGLLIQGRCWSESNICPPRWSRDRSTSPVREAERAGICLEKAQGDLIRAQKHEGRVQRQRKDPGFFQ